MPITFTCPLCGTRYALGLEAAGKKAKCRCGQVLKVPSRRNTYGRTSQRSPVGAPVSAPAVPQGLHQSARNATTTSKPEAEDPGPSGDGYRAVRTLSQSGLLELPALETILDVDPRRLEQLPLDQVETPYGILGCLATLGAGSGARWPITEHIGVCDPYFDRVMRMLKRRMSPWATPLFGGVTVTPAPVAQMRSWLRKAPPLYFFVNPTHFGVAACSSQHEYFDAYEVARVRGVDCRDRGSGQTELAITVDGRTDQLTVSFTGRGGRTPRASEVLDHVRLAAFFLENPHEFLVLEFVRRLSGVVPLIYARQDGQSVTRDLAREVSIHLGIARDLVAADGPYIFIAVKETGFEHEGFNFADLEWDELGFPDGASRFTFCRTLVSLVALLEARGFTWALGSDAAFGRKEQARTSRLLTTNPRFFDVDRLYFATTSGKDLSTGGLKELSTKASSRFHADLRGAGSWVVVTLKDYDTEVSLVDFLRSCGLRPMDGAEYDAWIKDQLCRDAERTQRALQERAWAEERAKEEDVLRRALASVAEPVLQGLTQEVRAIAGEVQANRQLGTALGMGLGALAWYKLDQIERRLRS